MVIDFRTRPPYKGFVTEGNFFPRPMEDQFADPTQVPGIYMGSVGIESARTGDMELYWKELSCSGIDLQVVQGRWVRPGMAQVSNDDVCEMHRRGGGNSPLPCPLRHPGHLPGAGLGHAAQVCG